MLTTTPAPYCCPSEPAPHNLLQRITQRIRQAVELPMILETAVSEVQQFLGCDRVMIYRFQPDNSGQVIAEWLGAERRLPTLQGLYFPSDDIPEAARQLFITMGVRNVIDVQSCKIAQSQFSQVAVETSEELMFRQLDPCHAEYLTTMGVQASVVIPILQQTNLWGLLVAHHATPLTVDAQHLDSLQLVVDQISIAITQAMLLKQARQVAEQESTISRIAEQLASVETLELQIALQETVSVLKGSGGRLFLASQPEGIQASYNLEDLEDFRLYTWGDQPASHPMQPTKVMEQFHAFEKTFANPQVQPWVIEDLYAVPLLRNLQPLFRATSIYGLLIIPIVIRQQKIGYLTIFRDAIETETLWAGQCDQDTRQTYPRQSFDIWKELSKGQIKSWSTNDIEMAQGIAQQFATAVTQFDLHQQIQGLNQNLHNLNISLEAQVEARTVELQQVNQYQQMLFNLVAKIRQSLDLETIFKITTTDVRDILGADRVGIYRFDPNSEFNDGEIIAEDVLPQFTSALTVKVHDHCFGERFAEIYRKGRVHAVSDIYQANLEDCFREVLERFEIKATLVAPILRGDDLWGLFCIHQCSQTRDWQPTEIQFVTQLASQVSIALEQANLFHQTQRQSAELKVVIAELKATQLQLVHQEKMSSLGRLVAGVAHEINNPVSFIHGNLSHIGEYVENLLTVLQAYQTECPQVSAAFEHQCSEIDLEFIARDLPKTLKSMHIGTDRIREIVLSLRNFSRLDESRVKSVNIHEGIDSTLMILQHKIKATYNRPEIKIIKEYGDLPLVECHASAINQVVMNLVNNAIDSLSTQWESLSEAERSSYSNQIWIKTRYFQDRETECERVMIQVQDNGQGISEAILPQIFDPFFTTKPVGQGTGLGLSISYQIITEQHHGKLTCASRLNQGTEFTIDIPTRLIEA